MGEFSGCMKRAIGGFGASLGFAIWNLWNVEPGRSGSALDGGEAGGYAARARYHDRVAFAAGACWEMEKGK
jgi:hypothetical protein